MRPWVATSRMVQLNASANRYFSKSAALANKSKMEEVSGTSGGRRTLTPEEEQEIVGRLKRQLDDQSSRLGTVPVFQRALQYGNSVAIKDQNGEFSYARLYMGAKRLSADISSICGKKKLGLYSSLMYDAIGDNILAFSECHIESIHLFHGNQRGRI